MNKKFSTINTDRLGLESEVTISLKNDLEKTRATRFDHKMHIDKDAKVEEIRKYRHDQDSKLLKDLIKKKNDEKADLIKKQADQDAAYKNHAELQAAISETNDLRAKIEIAKVQIMQKQIEIGLLQETTEALNRKKEELISEKQDSESKNEELKQQLKAQEDVAHKRLMNRLNQHKTQEIKELLIQQESLKEFNEQLTHKLMEEKEKFDKLTDAKITKDEEKRLLELQLAEDTHVTEEQKKELDELNKKIEAEQLKVNEIQKKVEEGRKVKALQEERRRQIQQVNTARLAKKEWIEKTYNYSDNVEQMKTEIFKQIVETNTDVNSQVNTFTTKLGNVQKELQTIKARNYTA